MAMSAATKAKIKGYAKTAGKFTLQYGLKGLAKGVELTSRGALATVNAIIKTPLVQRILIGAGLVGISALIPPVGVVLMVGFGLKVLSDNVIGGKNKSMLAMINESLDKRRGVTAGLSKTIESANRGIKTIGSKAQTKIDSWFK